MQTQSARGKFIVIEGDDGSGKTSVIKHLKDVFADSDIHFTREPGGCPGAEDIRKFFLRPETADFDWTTQLMLAEAARAEHLAKVVIPLREAGRHVITDRFDASTRAYNVPDGHSEYNNKYFSVINQMVTRRSRPTAYIYLNLPPLLASKRTDSRPEHQSRFDVQTVGIRTCRHEAYKIFFKTEISISESLFIIDATKSLEEVCAEVERLVRIHLGL